MNYADIKYFDISNGDGVRTSLFVSGCTNHCKGCFNQQTWDFNYGKPFTENVMNQILESLEPDYVRGFSLLGGDPMHPFNQEVVLSIVKRVKERFPNKTIWMWSGYRLDDEIIRGQAHTEFTDEILANIDVIVDGRFIEELKSPNLQWKGSSNQSVRYLKSNYTVR